ncbi:S-adenosyl-L-methionine-dependent methyltransferase [Sordaria sp. MPI-SDFR-AT-0083]|nr:S-adenosyl-L-methionine-dependent methyltransferase [Sordaria sp. MPI-SDFR-AT-0083]
MTRLFDGKLYAALLDKDKIRTALDIGTGTGVSAIDFADEHPNCTVTGTDISPIQPCRVPSNARFDIEDARKKLNFQLNYFDYIHIHWLTGTIADWSPTGRID